MAESSNYQKYATKNPFLKSINANFLDNIFFLAKQTNAANILDAGCGEGFVIERLKDDISARIVGLDIESTALKVAKEKNPDVNFQQASVYDLPFENKSFELIILSEVLEHLKEPEKALSEIRRVANDYIIISVPHEPIWRVGNMARFKYLKSFGNTPGHINHWTRRAFIGLISGFFEVKEIKTPFPWTVILCQQKNAK